MDFLSAPSDFLVQCFQKFDSKDLGVEDLGKEFSRRGNLSREIGRTVELHTKILHTKIL